MMRDPETPRKLSTAGRLVLVLLNPHQISCCGAAVSLLAASRSSSALICSSGGAPGQFTLTPRYLLRQTTH